MVSYPKTVTLFLTNGQENTCKMQNNAYRSIANTFPSLSSQSEHIKTLQTGLAYMYMCACSKIQSTNIHNTRLKLLIPFNFHLLQFTCITHISKMTLQKKASLMRITVVSQDAAVPCESRNVTWLEDIDLLPGSLGSLFSVPSVQNLCGKSNLEV